VSSELILASGSAIRRAILSSAGVEFTISKPCVDEDAAKAKNASLTPAKMATFLAAEKAREVSKRFPDCFVLGADQTMELDGNLMDKLPNKNLARQRMLDMKGKPHFLHSGISLFKNGVSIWEHQQTSTLHVRDFSNQFLDTYLETAGDELTASVGAYAYEGFGAQLFSSVEGDYYAVLGLPLIPLLKALREEGVILA
jgi:septum formation protein